MSPELGRSDGAGLRGCAGRFLATGYSRPAGSDPRRPPYFRAHASDGDDERPRPQFSAVPRSDRVVGQRRGGRPAPVRRVQPLPRRNERVGPIASRRRRPVISSTELQVLRRHVVGARGKSRSRSSPWIWPRSACRLLEPVDDRAWRRWTEARSSRFGAVRLAQAADRLVERHSVDALLLQRAPDPLGLGLPLLDLAPELAPRRPTPSRMGPAIAAGIARAGLGGPAGGAACLRLLPALLSPCCCHAAARPAAARPAGPFQPAALRPAAVPRSRPTATRARAARRPTVEPTHSSRMQSSACTSRSLSRLADRCCRLLECSP